MKSRGLRVGGIGIQLHIPIEVITPAFRRVPDADCNRDDGTPTRFDRPLDQLHMSVFGRPSTFAVVAPPTSCHNILPRLFAALGDRYDVVKGQLFCPVLTIAILAGVSITREDVDAAKLDGPVAVFEPHEFQEAHHRRQPDGDRDPVDLTVVDFEYLDFPLPQQRNRLLPMHDSQWFVGRVEQQGHFHFGPSIPTAAPL